MRWKVEGGRGKVRGEGETNGIAIPHEDEETEVCEDGVADPCWPELDIIDQQLPSLSIQIVRRNHTLGSPIVAVENTILNLDSTMSKETRRDDKGEEQGEKIKVGRLAIFIYTCPHNPASAHGK